MVSSVKHEPYEKLHASGLKQPLQRFLQPDTKRDRRQPVPLAISDDLSGKFSIFSLGTIFLSLE